MSTALLEEPKVDGELQKLCAYLADKPGPVAVEDLPKAMQAPGLIAKGLFKDLIEIGRRNYTELIKSVTPKKERNGTPILDENFRQVVTKEMQVVLDNDWSWTNLKGPYRQHLSDLLAEDKKLPEGVKLHLRLTTAGLAAS